MRSKLPSLVQILWEELFLCPRGLGLQREASGCSLWAEGGCYGPVAAEEERASAYQALGHGDGKGGGVTI